MKKVFFLFLALTLLLTACTGAPAPAPTATPAASAQPTPEASEPEATPQVTAEATPVASGDTPKFVVGLDDSFPPMGFRDDDSNLVGFDIDMAREVAKHMGREVELKPIDWDAKVLELNSGNIDCIWNGLSITPARQEEMDFTRPYLANKQVVVVPKDSAIKTIADLENKQIGLQSGSTALDAFSKHDISTKVPPLKEYADNALALNDLLIGRVEAVVVDEVVARYYAAKQPDKFTILAEDFGSEQYGIGIKKGNTELLNDVQQAFDAMLEDGTAAEISKKWFGEDVVLRP